MTARCRGVSPFLSWISFFGPARFLSQFQIPPLPPQPPFRSGQEGSEQDMDGSSVGSSVADNTLVAQSEDPETKREIRMFKQVLYDAFFDVMSDTRPWFRNEDAMGMGVAGLGVQPAPWQGSQPLDRPWKSRRRQTQPSEPSEASSESDSVSTWHRKGKRNQKRPAALRRGRRPSDATKAFGRCHPRAVF
ncbi:hypothetical protein B0T16DRAFT_394795 [Cercophora newfieldiana]|uniref:Uncharacterized protein n=1 Tax=Cercophora newfieldiana TaxID=92897 RepID=A0AA39XRP6_9PEZI|nr:hypothetical protein B0T16DRAFT_394795 [Cercophora newfieldiana]